MRPNDSPLSTCKRQIKPRVVPVRENIRLHDVLFCAPVRDKSEFDTWIRIAPTGGSEIVRDLCVFFFLFVTTCMAQCVILSLGGK